MSGIEDHDRDRDHWYSRREMHLDALETLFDEIEDEERRRALTKNNLRMRKERMRKHFEDMEQAHMMYRQVCILASNEVYEATERRFMEAVARIDDVMDEIRRREEAAEHANSSMHPAGQQVIRVETARPPQIGSFNGDPAAWPAFRDLFIAEVHNKDMEPVNKLLLLQRACVERAAETLGPWQPTGDNYQIAWKSMMDAYNDEYHVMHGILGKLFSLQPQERENHSSLNVVYHTITNGLRQLRTIRPNSDAILDQMCIHLAKRRLPRQTLDSWEQHRNEKKDEELPSCDEFLEFLCIKAKGRREFEYEESLPNQSAGKVQDADASDQRFKPYDKNHGRVEWHRRSRTDTSEGGRETSCIVRGCGQTHPIWRCDLFTKLSITQRKELTRQHQLCRCCLAPGHLSFACPRSGCPNCPDADFKHHVKLCPKSIDNEKAKPEALVSKKETESSQE